MTPTEAIRHLGALSAFANADEVKAVEMAIEALKDSKVPSSLYAVSPTVSFVAGVPVEPTLKPPRLSRNIIECRLCGDVIESKHRHDYKPCKCGKVAVDGGLSYIKRSGNEGDFIERSEWV
jgi:hypothetical protein